MSGHYEFEPWLRERLRADAPEPPVDEVDWAALRRRIAQSAEPALARLRRSARTAAWWDYAARWARPVLPAAVAAAAALLLLLARLQSAGTTTQPQAPVASAPRITVEAAIGAAPNDEVTSVLYAASDQDALLREAVNGR